MRTDKSYMIVISHFKLYPALFPLKWLICIPNISAVRGNVVFETLHDFYRTAIVFYQSVTNFSIILPVFLKGTSVIPVHYAFRLYWTFFDKRKQAYQTNFYKMTRHGCPRINLLLQNIGKTQQSSWR